MGKPLSPRIIEVSQGEAEETRHLTHLPTIVLRGSNLGLNISKYECRRALYQPSTSPDTSLVLLIKLRPVSHG
ncbi:hypothetical protein RRG08_058649 [Elysia crispata]|uniref:Uncharacterized protein n=1 Tax=Elysia crispata TaxID=231223 RepID=A0AAE1D7Y2_9GAST|nr:hypothetical protein RRG08_058649 [Elysia crispata]